MKPDYSWASITDEELDSILGEDDEDDPLADLWAQEGDE
jgi:hypothetical protein